MRSLELHCIVERAIGSLDLEVSDIDSLTLYEANQSPWSLHNGFRLGYGSAELRTRNRSIWIEKSTMPRSALSLAAAGRLLGDGGIARMLPEAGPRGNGNFSRAADCDRGSRRSTLTLVK